MPCYRTLSMSAAAVGEVPLQDAVYVPAPVDKIFGVSGVYVVKLNATTGAVEGSVRISSPVNNGARICYHAATGLLYATVWNEPNLGDTGLVHPNKDVYPINPATMTVNPRMDIIAASGFIVDDDFNDSSLNPAWGPRWIASQGNYLYIQFNSTNAYQFIRIDPNNLTDHCTDAGSIFRGFEAQQLAVGPVYIVSPYPLDEGFSYAVIGWNNSTEWEDFDIAPGGYWPTGVDYCPLNTLYYAVDGLGNLFRIDDLIAETVTVIPIPAGVGVPTPNPCRLRWNTYNSLFYLPCMTDNAIVLYDPITETWEGYKTGFENPVDIVITPTKAWAVQNSPDEPLKEITL